MATSRDWRWGVEKGGGREGLGPPTPDRCLPAETLTQEVTELRVQHPQQQQQLSELPLHRLLTLLEVPVLREGGRAT